MQQRKLSFKVKIAYSFRVELLGKFNGVWTRNEKWNLSFSLLISLCYIISICYMFFINSVLKWEQL